MRRNSATLTRKLNMHVPVNTCTSTILMAFNYSELHYMHWHHDHSPYSFVYSHYWISTDRGHDTYDWTFGADDADYSTKRSTCQHTREHYQMWVADVVLSNPQEGRELVPNQKPVVRRLP